MKCNTDSKSTIHILVLLIAGSLCGNLLKASENPVVIAPGERGTVQCLVHPGYKYDLYLPSSYGKSKPLPIIYTSSPNGSGMVNAYKALGEKLQVIVVGNLGYRNNCPNYKIIGDVYAMLYDIRNRIEFDPTAQFAAGMSGGAWQSYNIARWHPEAISGVIAIGGWLGMEYDPRFRHRQGLLVARGCGVNDRGSNSMRKRDSDFLLRFDAKIRDWSFPGGHIDAPVNIKTEMMQWLLAERRNQNNQDRKQTTAISQRWRAAVKKGSGSRVMVECVQTILTNPGTWLALEAQKQIDDLTKDYTQFETYPLVGLPTGQSAEDYFGFMAYGTGLAGDVDRFQAALKCFNHCGNCDPEWARILGTILLFAPNQNIRNIKTGQKLIDNALQKHTENDSLKILAAAFSIETKQFDKATQLLKYVQLPALIYTGPNGKEIIKQEKKAYAELKNSLTNRTNHLKAKTWLEMIPD